MILILLLIKIDSVKISLDEFIKLAFKKNPEIKMEEKNDLLRNIDFVNSVFSNLPSVSAQGSYSDTRRGIKTFIPGVPTPIFYSVSKGYTFTTSINVPILSPSNLIGALDSYFEKERGRLYLTEYKMKFIYELESKYFNVLRTRNILKAVQKSLERAEENYKLAEEKYKNGLISYLDFMNIKIQVNDAYLNKSQAEKNFYDALYDFNYIIGEEKDFLYIPLDIEIETLKFEEKEKNLFYPVESEKQVKKAQNLNFIYSVFSFMPEVYLSYYYSFSDSSLNSLFRNPESSRGLYVTFSLRFWDYPFNILRNKIRRDFENENFKRIYLLSKINYEKAKREIEISKKALDISKEKLKNSEIGYKYAEESFKLGKLSSIELRQAEENLKNSEVDYINSLYNYKLSVSFYLYLTGNLTYKGGEIK
ncbi:MAG: TolC family protein [candidate division WOR-3 bacterium]